MINNLEDLMVALNFSWAKDIQRDWKDIKIRAYLDGRYVIQEVKVSPDDGAIVLWLDERGDPNEA